QELLEEKILSFSIKKFLNRLFDSLSRTQKRMIQFRFYKQMEYAETCEILDLIYQSVRTLTCRAISRMWEAYQKKHFVAERNKNCE
ncbi:MAG: sigma factor-like helix-turn-helix DNA-binding protein, partial [bacterium]